MAKIQPISGARVEDLIRSRRAFQIPVTDIPHDDRVHALILDMMQEGASVTQVAARLGVARTTVDKWRKRYDSFRELMEMGETLSQAWWEDQLAAGLTQGPGFHASACAFAMKARFPRDYRDVQHMVHSANPLREVIEAVREGRRPEALVGEAASEGVESRADRHLPFESTFRKEAFK